MNKKGQIATEYLIIVGIALLTSLVIFASYSGYSEKVESTISINQIDSIAHNIVDIAEVVYYQGSPSQQTLDVSMPKGVKNITILTNELTFQVQTRSGLSDIHYISDVPISGIIVIYPGKREIIIQARDDGVWINGT